MRRSLPLLWLVALAACGGTERQRTSFPVTVSGGVATVTTDSGWSVSLTKATAHLDAVRFFEGKVLLGRAYPRPPWWRSLLVTPAFAHPGHYVPGEALGELVGPLSVDLLAATPTPWGEASAVTGAQGSLQLTFGAGGLELAGTATKDAQSLPFTAVFAPTAAVEGVRAEHVVTTSGAGVDVRLDLAVIFSRVDFALVGSSASPLDPTSPAFNGLARGVVDTSAWVVAWQGD